MAYHRSQELQATKTSRVTFSQAETPPRRRYRMAKNFLYLSSSSSSESPSVCLAVLSPVRACLCACLCFCASLWSPVHFAIIARCRLGRGANTAMIIYRHRCHKMHPLLHRLLLCFCSPQKFSFVLPSSFNSNLLLTTLQRSFQSSGNHHNHDEKGRIVYRRRETDDFLFPA